jgi:hypothetical protein
MQFEKSWFFKQEVPYVLVEFGQNQGLWRQNGDTNCQGIVAFSRSKNLGRRGVTSLAHILCLRQL